MKKTLLYLAIFFTSFIVKAQNGLENVIVERYYISDANDTSVNSVGGVLPIGSVTYRIYLDMLPGYKFQAAYGVNTPGAMHELRIETTSLFFNNEDRGATSPTYTKNQAKNNTVLLDSWLSVGAACVGNFGILKSEDDGVSTIINTDGVLVNTDPLAGIPLSTQDGLILGSPEPVTIVGISNEVGVFDAQNDGTNGPLFSTFNGSWASLNGSTGYDSTNKVLIAQITTDGVFSFELNVQLGTPSGGVEQFVAKNPVGNEIVFSGLTYNSATAVKAVQQFNQLLNIYPNPATESVNVVYQTNSSPEKVVCQLVDMSGRTVITKSFTPSVSKQVESIDLAGISKGMYFMILQHEGKREVKKLIKN
jgi:hypothetical protein